MKWLKTLWSKLVSKTSTSVTVVEVEEEYSIGDLFLEACAELGIGSKILDATGALEKFENWYDGPVDKKSVADSIRAFAKADPGVYAKFQRFIK